MPKFSSIVIKTETIAQARYQLEVLEEWIASESKCTVEVDSDMVFFSARPHHLLESVSKLYRLEKLLEGVRKDMRKALRVVSDTLTVSVNGRKEFVAILDGMRPAYGLASLPDEVLACIFEAAKKEPQCKFDADDWSLAFRLSAVCRRFRNVALGHRRMWTYIGNDMLKCILKNCLVRSQKLNAGLDVNLSSEPDGQMSHRIFCDMAVEHCERWTSLAASIFCEAQPDINIRALRDTLCNPLTLLPRLRHISFVLPQYGAFLESVFRKLESSAPNLQKIYLWCDRTLPVFLPNMITSLELQTQDSFGTNDLLLTLSSAPLLENIKLEFEVSNEDLDPTLDVQRVVYPGVRTLDLDIRIPDILYHSFFTRASFPNVTRLSLVAGFVNACLIKSVMDDIFSNSYLSINHLDLTILHTFGNTAWPFGEIFYARPKLQHLAISCDFKFGAGEVHIPPLRTLKLRHCSAENIEWLREYVGKLKADGHWDDFEMLSMDRTVQRGDLTLTTLAEVMDGKMLVE